MRETGGTGHDAPGELGADGDDRRIYVYGTVFRDEASGRFRLWYNRGQQTLFATSDDGVHWQRPRLGICEVAGSTDNNVVLQLLHSPSVVYNSEPDESEDPYQMIGYGARDGRGYYAAHSPDGLHWTPYPKNPVLKTGDTCTLMFDERTGEYLAFYKQNHKLRGASRRLVYLSTSRDMQNWSKATRVMAPGRDRRRSGEGGRGQERPVLQHVGLPLCQSIPWICNPLPLHGAAGSQRTAAKRRTTGRSTCNSCTVATGDGGSVARIARR